MLFIFCANRIYVNAAALIKFLRFQYGVYPRTAFIRGRRFQSPAQRFEICHVLAFLFSLCFTATVKRILVCYTAVFSVVTQRSSRDDTKNGCVADLKEPRGSYYHPIHTRYQQRDSPVVVFISCIVLVLLLVGSY